MLVIITGPTGVGKTAVAIELARELDTEIISADSMQVYRHLSIGTAKPPASELEGVRYNLIDYVDPDHQYNAGDFVRDAEAVLARLGPDASPVICGGTAMYLRALTCGLFEAESRDPAVRDRLRREADSGGLPRLYEQLMAVDPAATHIMPGDRQRILRALEVYHVTGRPITSLQTQSQDPPRHQARTFVLMRPRPVIYARIDSRVDEMMRAGLLDEVRQYLARGYSRTNPAVRALGYSELIEHVEGRVGLCEAVEQMKRKTRQFAKRQLTWFRSMRDAETIEVEGRSARDTAQDIKKRLAATAHRA